MNNESESVFLKAIKTSDKESQMLVAMEQCAELTQALYHEMRGRNPENLCEEIADVSIMIEQLKLMFDGEKVDEIIKEKIKRLGLRIKNKR